jgi:D-alanine-D-alanine ligase
VIFGGRSVEHDVSIVTGSQVMRALDPDFYEVVPIYITRDGKWLSGAPLLDLKNFQNEVISLKGVEQVVLSPATHHHGLIVNPIPSGLLAKSQIKRLDVIFPAVHGSHGEDGTLQGLFELADIPYVGCGVMASAIANDKLMTKTILKVHGIPTVEVVSFTRHQWDDDADAIVEHITSKLSFPVFVKPVTLGSSIGINRAPDENMLRISIDVAANLDRRIMVEGAIVGCIEINCSVMGDDREVIASVLEQPVSWEQFLSFEQKYLHGGEGMKSAERIIPAPLSDNLTKRVQQYAVDAFKAIDGRGIARLDFLVKPESDQVYLNEINTMPGSLAFYLWQEQDIPPRYLVHRLVKLAQDAHADKRRNTYDYQTNLINVTAARGLKGMKGAKSSRRTNGEDHR